MDFFGEGGLAAATKLVSLGNGFHVTVGLLGPEDAERCRALLSGGKAGKTRLTVRGKEQDDVEQVTELSNDMKEYRETYLLAVIREWNLTDKGQVQPVDLPTLRRVPERYLNLIFVAAKEFNEPLTSKQVGESDSPPMDSSRGAAAE